MPQSRYKWDFWNLLSSLCIFMIRKCSDIKGVPKVRTCENSAREASFIESTNEYAIGMFLVAHKKALLRPILPKSPLLLLVFPQFQDYATVKFNIHFVSNLFLVSSFERALDSYFEARGLNPDSVNKYSTNCPEQKLQIYFIAPLLASGTH